MNTVEKSQAERICSLYFAVLLWVMAFLYWFPIVLGKLGVVPTWKSLTYECMDTLRECVNDKKQCVSTVKTER